MSFASQVTLAMQRIAAEFKAVRSEFAPETGTTLSSATLPSTSKPWSASQTKAMILGLINDATSSANDRVWSAAQAKSYADNLLGSAAGIEAVQDVVGAFLVGGSYDDPNNTYILPGGGVLASAPLDASSYGFSTTKTAAQNAAALYNAVLAAGKRPVCAPSGRYLCSNLNFVNEDVHFDMPGVTLVQPVADPNPILTVERTLGAPVSVGPTRVVEWGPRAPGGISSSARYTAIDLTTAGNYKNYRGGDLIHISSKDHYPWDWTANKYDIATQDVNKGTFQAEYLTILGIGLKVDVLTNGGPREQMTVQGSISGATGLIQADLVGNATSGSSITATQAHITFAKVSGDFVNGDILTRITGGNPDGGATTGIATVGQAVGTVSGAPMLLINKLLDYQYGRTTAAQAAAGTQTPIDTTATVRIRLVDRTKICVVKTNFDIDGIAGDQDAYQTVRTDMVKFRCVYMPQFDSRVFNSWTRAVVVTSCYEGRWRGMFDGLPNHAYLDQNGFGYGFECKCASQGNVFEYIARNLRHSFTTNPNPRTFNQADSSFVDYGTPMDNIVQNSVAIATFTNSYDTHPGDIRTRFVNCVAISGGSAGRYNSDGGAHFASRGFGTQWINCRSLNSAEGINILGTEHDPGFDHTYEITNCVVDKFQSRGIYVVDSITNRATLVIDGGRFIGDGSPTNQQYQHEGLALGKGLKVLLKGDPEIGGFNGFPIRMREAGTAGIQSELDIVSAIFNYRTSTANAQGIRVDGTLAKANLGDITLLLPDASTLAGLITNRGGNTAFKIGDVKLFGTVATTLPVFQVASAGGTPTYAALTKLISSSGPSLPGGGTAGQVLKKNTATDGDASWAADAGLPVGGSTGQYLRKSSTTDGDAAWNWLPSYTKVNLDGVFQPVLDISSILMDQNGVGIPAGFRKTSSYVRTSAATTTSPNSVFIYPLDVRGTPVTKVGIQTSVAQVGGATTFRVAIFADANGLPDLTTGPVQTVTVDLTAAIGKQDVALTTPLAPGNYWIGTWYQVTTAPTTVATLYTISGVSWSLPIPAASPVNTTPTSFAWRSMSAWPTDFTAAGVASTTETPTVYVMTA